ncbi:M50 family metallopeptidase [Domibacillus indicus]|uniref:M50 family metallopeptidase n=1 Tax=Domibacillus TaxID=1433999 RepID=UPI001F56B5D6|nr:MULTISPECIES: M50 family metallopeptidase [Domibacillus]MCI2254884.1 M50 family metallopeptidase [Domibacillus sp. PGB-M46]MCM3789117.1 M50 family metallopeptidase [Domibacillus indicus]WNS80190.1 M50 family metallopeptidase [Domibacillus sp. DTU_2020_1001157_1_SI_ALB_TIR_016]
MTISQAMLFVGAAILLTCIPIAGKYFRVLNTLLHEIGHVLASLLSGGGIHHVQLFWDTSGVAYTTHANRLAAIVTSLAGYPFASASAFFVAWASLNGYTGWLYYGLFMILAVSLVLWVRNWFGFLWLVAFFAGTAAIYMYASGAVQQAYMYVITAVLLVESVRSSWVIFYLSLISPQKAGDASALKRSTGISSRVWGLLFLIQALYFGIYLPGKLLAG